MSRTLPSGIQSEITKEVVYPFFAVELYFQSETVRLWTGYGELEYPPESGTIYLGAGTLLNISSVEETTEIEAKGASITMSGIPSTLLSLALSEPYQGRLCRILFGMSIPNASLISQASQELITQDLFELSVQNGGTNLVEIFSGELDQMTITEEGETCTISVTAENVLIKLERPTVRRLTDQDQKSRYPTDRGLEFIASLQDKEIFWGRKAA
jgi:hypothetical protein